MLEIIKAKIAELEEQRNIRVLYACESGSRAWGFPSPDSDYDVRFIYARPTDDYLSIHDIKDVEDLPVNEVLDIGGWDIRKALKLFLKSNGPLYEWLQSPIIYKNDSSFSNELLSLMPNYFSLRSAGNHYLSMALNTVNNDLQGAEVKIKRYFYALRSSLACKWIVEKHEVPPMEFHKLRVLISDQNVQNSLDELMNLKLVSNEKTLIALVPDLDEWLNETLALCKQQVALLPPNLQPAEELNKIFSRYVANDI